LRIVSRASLPDFSVAQSGSGYSSYFVEAFAYFCTAAFGFECIITFFLCMLYSAQAMNSLLYAENPLSLEDFLVSSVAKDPWNYMTIGIVSLVFFIAPG
jgi:hypothetical protein